MYESFFHQETKFQVIGLGWWKAKEVLDSLFCSKKGNVASALQTKKERGSRIKVYFNSHIIQVFNP